MDSIIFCLLLLLVRIALYLSHCEPPTCPVTSVDSRCHLKASGFGHFWVPPVPCVFGTFAPSAVSPYYFWPVETFTVTPAPAPLPLVSVPALCVMWKSVMTSMAYFVKCAVIGVTAPVSVCLRPITFTWPQLTVGGFAPGVKQKSFPFMMFPNFLTSIVITALS